MRFYMFWLDNIQILCSQINHFYFVQCTKITRASFYVNKYGFDISDQNIYELRIVISYTPWSMFNTYPRHLGDVVKAVLTNIW